VTRDFLRDVLGKSLSQYRAYWKRRLFSGGGTVPKAIQTSEEVLAFGLIMYMNFKTSDTVASQLERVKEESVPRFVEASALEARFDAMARLIEDAIVIGDPALLEASDAEKVLFGEHLRQQLALATETEQSELLEFERDLDQYHTKAGELAQLLLAGEEEGEGLGFLSAAETSRLAGTVSELREDLETRLDALSQTRKADLDL
jgi:hypothetical protein